MIRALLVDDEPLGIRALRALLDPVPDVTPVGEARTVEEAARLCRDLRPEVVFLDIQLRGETGFDLLARLPSPWPRIVFVTAYDRYAVRAFETNALDYLLKPVEPERLAVTLERIRTRTRPPAAERDADDRVLVKFKREVRWVPWSDVVRIESDGNYTHLELVSGESAMMHQALNAWLELAPPDVVRVHRRHLIHLRHLVSVDSPKPGTRRLELTGGVSVPVGRSYWPALKDRLRSGGET